jgi:hypothetical protein
MCHLLQAEGSAAGAAAGQEEDKEWQRLFALMELYPKQQGSTAATVAAAGAQCAAVQGAAVQLQPAAVPGTPAKQDQQAPLKTPCECVPHDSLYELYCAQADIVDAAINILCVGCLC